MAKQSPKTRKQDNSTQQQPTILVAACRCGEACRYHGRLVDSPALQKELTKVSVKKTCPELAAGFGVPRPPVRIQQGRAIMDGKDVTERLKNACETLAAKFAGKVECYVGVKGSPTCDPKTGIFPRILRGLGVSSRAALSHPGEERK